MIYLLRPDRAGKLQLGVQEAAHTLSYILTEHWMYCNIYTITVSTFIIRDRMWSKRGGVIVTANEMFGRKWKIPSRTSDIIDMDTAPQQKQMRESGKCFGKLGPYY